MNNSEINRAARKNGKSDKAPRGAEIRKDFDESFSEYAAKIYAMAFIHIKKPDDTAELVEEVYLKLLLRKKDFETADERRRWIFKTAHSSIMDYFRIKMRKKIRLEDMKKLSLPFKPDSLLNEIFMLPDNLKSSLYLMYAEGMSAEETAKMISGTSGSVNSRLAKAEELLKKSGALKNTDKPQERIKASLKLISLPDSVGKHIYYEIKRKFQDKAFISKARLSYRKHILDRYIPFIAVLCIGVVVYAFLAVENGWITGSKYVESTELAENYGYTYEGEDSTIAEVLEYYGVTPMPSSADESESSSEPEPETVTLESYAGDEEVTLTGFDGDAFALWDELVSTGAVPADMNLTAFSVDSTDAQNEVLVLAFDSDLSEYEDADALAEVIKTDFLKIFPEYADVRIQTASSEAEE